MIIEIGVSGDLYSKMNSFAVCSTSEHCLLQNLTQSRDKHDE